MNSNRRSINLSPIPEQTADRCERCTLCTKGFSKVIGGIIACPIICPISFVAGTFYGAYQTCKLEGGGPCYETEIQDRNAVCIGCGIITAMHASSLIIYEGVHDMKRSITVQQDMKR